jgi:hypothetical protein
VNDQNIYTGRNSQIGQYLPDNLHYVRYDIEDELTWGFLQDCKNLFLVVPKIPRALDHCKEFVYTAKQAGVKKIVKIGSMGSWRVIHNQIDAYIRDCGINCISFDISVLMNNIFTEQYIGTTLLNYRHDTPAPYLDPKVLALAIQQAMRREALLNFNIKATGLSQYSIEDVKRILESNGYPVTSIKTIHNNQLHKNAGVSADQRLMSDISDDYALGIYPKINTDITRMFGAVHRTLEDFVAEDVNYYTKSYEGDRNL